MGRSKFSNLARSMPAGDLSLSARDRASNAIWILEELSSNYLRWHASFTKKQLDELDTITVLHCMLCAFQLLWHQCNNRSSREIATSNKRSCARTTGRRQSRQASTSVRQYLPVDAIIAISFKEPNEGLADCHIIGRGVVVQLLVPVLRSNT